MDKHVLWHRGAGKKIMAAKAAEIKPAATTEVLEKELAKDTKVAPEKHENIDDLPVSEVTGIGPVAAKKLRECGIENVPALAVAVAEDLAEVTKATKETATTWILGAQQLLREHDYLGKTLMDGTEAMERRKRVQFLKTGSAAFDALLKGGIETSAVTEFYSEFGAGKTQVCKSLAINAQLPVEKGGLGGKVLYVDTEGTYRPERLAEMSQARGLDPAEVQRNMVISRLHSASALELLVKDLGKYISKFKIKLLIIDSITNLHRKEYLGRGTLADRQARLNSVMGYLVRQAEIFNIAIIITNQVQSSPGGSPYMDSTKPVGGNVVAHSSTYRLYLIKAGKNRIAKMIDSPYHPYSDIRFSITKAGIGEEGDNDGEKEEKEK